MMSRPSFHVGISEHRLLAFAGPEAKEGPKVAKGLEDLVMKEGKGSEVIRKNPYAYDTVQDRISKYVKKVANLRAKNAITDKEEQDTKALIERPLKAERTTRDVAGLEMFKTWKEFKDSWSGNAGYLFRAKNEGGTIVVQSKFGTGEWIPFKGNAATLLGRSGLTGPDGVPLFAFGAEASTYSDKNLENLSAGRKVAPGAEVMSRMFWSVEKLEEHYAKVEDIIGKLEAKATADGTVVEPMLQKELADEARAKLDAQLNATEAKDMLQTVHIDKFAKPFTEILERAYHLLRIPAATKATFTDGSGKEIRGIAQEITISGGYKYLKIMPAFMRKPQSELSKLRLDLDGTVLSLKKTDDGLDNIIFQKAPVTATLTTGEPLTVTPPPRVGVMKPSVKATAKIKPTPPPAEKPADTVIPPADTVVAPTVIPQKPLEVVAEEKFEYETPSQAASVFDSRVREYNEAAEDVKNEPGRDACLAIVALARKFPLDLKKVTVKVKNVDTGAVEDQTAYAQNYLQSTFKDFLLKAAADADEFLTLSNTTKYDNRLGTLNGAATAYGIALKGKKPADALKAARVLYGASEDFKFLYPKARTPWTPELTALVEGLPAKIAELEKTVVPDEKAEKKEKLGLALVAFDAEYDVIVERKEPVDAREVLALYTSGKKLLAFVREMADAYPSDYPDLETTVRRKMAKVEDRLEELYVKKGASPFPATRLEADDLATPVEYAGNVEPTLKETIKLKIADMEKNFPRDTYGYTVRVVRNQIVVTHFATNVVARYEVNQPTMKRLDGPKTVLPFEFDVGKDIVKDMQMDEYKARKDQYDNALLRPGLGADKFLYSRIDGLVARFKDGFPSTDEERAKVSIVDARGRLREVRVDTLSKKAREELITGQIALQGGGEVKGEDLFGGEKGYVYATRLEKVLGVSIPVLKRVKEADKADASKWMTFK